MPPWAMVMVPYWPAGRTSISPSSTKMSGLGWLASKAAARKAGSGWKIGGA